ncbi:MAG TPA: vWA domain-containing protein [Planctomycetota bacterium]|nr:vWA domain-containing protein [Planctomycetota bacterium]
MSRALERWASRIDGLAACLLLAVSTSARAQDSAGALTKENLDLPYDALGEDEEEEEAPEVVSFYGQSLEGDGFFYAIDRSGSMLDSGELTLAKQEVTKNISEFTDRVQFGVVFFAREAVKFPPGGQPADATPALKSSAISWVNSAQGSHGSCPQTGLIAALQMANQASAKRKVLVYLGDGGGNCAGVDEGTYLSQTLAVVTSQNFQRITINTIGVLSYGQIQEKFLRNLAASNGGTYTKISR